MDRQPSNANKFAQDAGMTFEEVFDFAYADYIPVLRYLSNELGPDAFIRLLEQASSEAAAGEARKAAQSLPHNDFAAWTGTLREPNRFWKHVLTFEVVEDTPSAFEVKITECLWARTFRAADAADIGYAAICHPDYASCQAFNPRIRMLRSQTLMQGDDYCNHRWVWEE